MAPNISDEDIDFVFVPETKIHGDAYEVDKRHSVGEEELGEVHSEDAEMREEESEVARELDSISEGNDNAVTVLDESTMEETIQDTDTEAEIELSARETVETEREYIADVRIGESHEETSRKEAVTAEDTAKKKNKRRLPAEPIRNSERMERKYKMKSK